MVRRLSPRRGPAVPRAAGESLAPWAGADGRGQAGERRNRDRTGRAAPGRSPRVTELDELDRRLLRLLVRDGRRSFTDLARDTGLSTSAVHQRVRRLEQREVITGYTVRFDAEAAGVPLTAFISVTPIDPAAPDDAPDRLQSLAAVEACHSVAGTESYILKVRVSGPGELEALLTEIRAVAGVLTCTTVVLSTPWEDRSAFGQARDAP